MTLCHGNCLEEQKVVSGRCCALAQKKRWDMRRHFPSVVIRPSAPKFAEELTHRDFLGALMNLGIERDVLGDIIVRGAVGYVFCEDAMADYLEKNITQVRHTTMTTEVTKECPAQAAPQFAEQ